MFIIRVNLSMFSFYLSKVTTVVLTDNKPIIKYDPLD